MSETQQSTTQNVSGPDPKVLMQHNRCKLYYKDTLPEQVNARTCQYLSFSSPVTVVLLYEVLHHCKVASACCMRESTVLILFKVKNTTYTYIFVHTPSHYQATHSSDVEQPPLATYSASCNVCLFSRDCKSNCNSYNLRYTTSTSWGWWGQV